MVSIKFTTAGDMPATTIVRACPPQSPGVSVCNNWRVLGLAPAAAAGAVDVTALFTAKFGAPKAGQKLFFQLQEVAGAYTTIPTQYEGLVPAAG